MSAGPDDPLKPPAPSPVDIASTGAKVVASVGLSAVTGLPVAPVVAWLYDLVVPSGFQRRTRAFQEEVAEAIAELKERFGKLPEELEKNEDFLDVVARAGVAAMKDHRREKWELLRNALVNSIVQPNLEADTRQVLLQFIDDLTLTHIAILKGMSNPQPNPSIHDTSIYRLSVKDFAQRLLGKSKDDDTTVEMFIDQLEQQGLLVGSNPVFLDSVGNVKLSSIGKRLVSFIQSPTDAGTR